jgi:hypothetical protein
MPCDNSVETALLNRSGTGLHTFTFDELDLKSVSFGSQTFGGLQFDQVSLAVASAVPEPSTWAMMIPGFAGVGFVAYRRCLINLNWML